jgi:flagellar hook-associated protein 1 FlgK
MGLTQALATSLSGLTATQTGLSVVAGNVANAQTAGYIAQSVTLTPTTSGDGGEGVRVTSINRVLDTFLQTQLRSESAGGAYADMKAGFYQQLQQVYGQPGSDTSLDAIFNNFTSAAQALSTNPSSFTTQSQTISAAQALAQQLNSATQSIQALRSEADQGIANDVQQANNALQQIANINQQLAGGTPNDAAAVQLENQRDQYIDQLSKLMNVRVVKGDQGQLSVFTSNGTQLVGTQAGQLSFTPLGTITASQLWNSDPSKSALSSITLTTPGGNTVDLLTNGAFKSGEIAAYAEMRDQTLVQAQGQLDEMAAQMSKALSDTTTAGSAVTGPPAGYSVDIAGMSNGNTIQVTYTDASSVQHNVTIMRVDDAAALPLSNSVTADPNDTVIGVPFSGGAAAVASALNTALGATGLQFNNPTGSELDIVNSGAPAVTVNSASTTSTATTLTGGSGALPLFTDGLNAFTGAMTGAGPQSLGYAGRITVNPALIASPSNLVTYQTSPATPAGDATRPNYIYNQLTSASLEYAPATGIGAANSPFSGTLSAYLGQVVSTQSIAASAASNLKAGQDVVVNALQTRFNSTSGVNIDTEMGNLLALQNSYSANARVMSTVKSMLDSLMQVM